MSPSRLGRLALVAALAAGPAAAAEREPFEMIKGWEVERNVGDTSANPCLMTHAYVDKDDSDAENVIVFKLDGGKAVLVLGYENWAFDKEEKVTAPLLVGKKSINAKSSWTGNGKYLRGVFQDTIVPDLMAGKTINLNFPDGAADFEIPDFAAGYASLRRCDAAPPAKAAAAAAPPAPAPKAVPAGPSEAAMTTYLLGRMVQQVMSECDVATTAKQRTAVDAKLAELKPQMAAVESQVTEQLGKRDPRCPPAGDEPKFQATLKDFLDLAPDAFVAAVTKRAQEAGAKPAP